MGADRLAAPGQRVEEGGGASSATTVPRASQLGDHRSADPTAPATVAAGDYHHERHPGDPRREYDRSSAGDVLVLLLGGSVAHP